MPIRRVAIDDEDQHSGYISPGADLAADVPADPERELSAAHEADANFAEEVAKLRQRGWSVARIALELYATEDEVRGCPVFVEDDDLRQTPEEVYGLEPEFE